MKLRWNFIAIGATCAAGSEKGSCISCSPEITGNMWKATEALGTLSCYALSLEDKRRNRTKKLSYFFLFYTELRIFF
jgi:hypothetical protein